MKKRTDICHIVGPSILGPEISEEEKKKMILIRDKVAQEIIDRMDRLDKNYETVSCPNCGALIKITNNEYGICDYCNSTVYGTKTYIKRK